MYLYLAFERALHMSCYGISKGILNEVDNEEERKEVRSELVKFLAECAAII